VCGPPQTRAAPPRRPPGPPACRARTRATLTRAPARRSLWERRSAEREQAAAAAAAEERESFAAQLREAKRRAAEDVAAAADRTVAAEAMAAAAAADGRTRTERLAAEYESRELWEGHGAAPRPSRAAA